MMEQANTERNHTPTMHWPTDPDIRTASQLNGTGLSQPDSSEGERQQNLEWWLKQIAVQLAGIREQLDAIRTRPWPKYRIRETED